MNILRYIGLTTLGLFFLQLCIGSEPITSKEKFPRETMEETQLRWHRQAIYSKFLKENSSCVPLNYFESIPRQELIAWLLTAEEIFPGEPIAQRNIVMSQIKIYKSIQGYNYNDISR